MNQVNRFTVVGRTGADVELRDAGTDKVHAFLSVANDSSYKNRDGEAVDRVEWFDIAAFGSLARSLATLGKGSLVYIEATAHQHEFEAGGKKYRTTRFRATRIDFLDYRPAGADSDAGEELALAA